MTHPDSQIRQRGTSSRPLRVMAVDPHPIYLRGIASVVDGCADMQTVAKGISVGDLLAHACSTPLDVVVIEPFVGNGDGLSAIRQLTLQSPEVAVIALSHAGDPHSVNLAIANGARAYLEKTSPEDQLPFVIRQAADGLSIRPIAPRGRDGLLSAREFEVLALLATGAANREIARSLFISESTVRFHLHNIYAKLGAKSRTEAARIAIERRLVG